MSEFIDFLTLSDNLPFSVALILMVLLGATSAIGIDFDSEVVLDMDAGSSAEGVPLPDAQSRDLPVMITAAAFFTIYGLIGLTGQQFVLDATGDTLNGFFAGLLAVIPSVILLMPTVNVLSRILPKDETYAVHVSDLVRRRGTIDVGTATATCATTATFRDRHGNPHTLLVAMALENETATTGDEVRIMELGKGDRPTTVVRTSPSDPFGRD